MVNERLTARFDSKKLTRILHLRQDGGVLLSAAVNHAVPDWRDWRGPPLSGFATRKKEHVMITAETLSVELFADGADRASIQRLAANPQIKGFTTNPTLMRKAGISDYEAFARD